MDRHDGRQRARVFDFRARVAPRPGAPARLLAAMDQYGIDRAAVTAGGVVDPDLLAEQVIRGGHVETDADNEAALAACEASGGRLVPFWFGNPHGEGPDAYRKNAHRFRGLEISPAVHGVPLADDRTTALVEAAAEAGHAVYLVCLGRPGVGVTDLVALAGRFPDVTFVLGHCGFVGIDLYAVNTVRPVPNIVAETSGCYTGVARAALERLGPDRVLFGTEFPLQHPSVELAKMRALELDDATWHRVAWANAHRLLGEEAP
ncbi:amidohydrolase family protein [Streptomyces sp. NPDC047928]|uniref:amidohydrolase family protein n=1 Tax=unclassified Streptomyces TaxID=2593676 RepID=UPI00371FBB0A